MSKRVPENTPVSETEEKQMDDLYKKFAKKFEKTPKPTRLTMIRFIRGYKTDPNSEKKTSDMLEKYLDWRIEKGIDRLLTTKLPKRDEWNKTWPTGVHGVSKDGHPVYIERPGQCDPSVLASKFKEDEMLELHVQIMEELGAFKEKLAAERKQQFYKHVVVTDMAGLGAKHMSKRFYAPIKKLIETDQNCYPETLHCLIIVNSSWVLRALWKIGSPWIDPVTRSNIHWGTEALHKFIDEGNIPQFLGGKCKCKGGKCLEVPFEAGESKAPSVPASDSSASLDTTGGGSDPPDEGGDADKNAKLEGDDEVST